MSALSALSTLLTLPQPGWPRRAASGCGRCAPALRCLLLVWVQALALLLAGGVAQAAEPASRVGRISFIKGGVDTAQRSSADTGDTEDSIDWAAATLNTPVTRGTRVRASPQSQAELRIGSMAWALQGNTELRVQALDDEAVVIELLHGNLALNLRALRSGQSLQVTAGGAVRDAAPAQSAATVLQPGAYHFTHNPGAHRFELRVFEGQAALQTPNGPFDVPALQLAQVDTRSRQVQVQSVAERGRFDDWASQRARRADRPAVGRWVSAEMTGAEVLDDHGTWRDDPRTGVLWFPRAVDADWAPYRQGHWVWLSPWGWTWVDDAPWGFAPFHYGRWLFVGGRWGWAPGAYVAHPVFAPALVGFFSRAEPAARVVAGGEWVGWFPLAPGEPYRPAYAANAQQLQALNGGVALRADAPGRSYRYAQTSFAATALAREGFASGQTASNQQVPLTPSMLASTTMLNGGAPALAAPAPAGGSAQRTALVAHAASQPARAWPQPRRAAPAPHANAARAAPHPELLPAAHPEPHPEPHPHAGRATR